MGHQLPVGHGLDRLILKEPPGAPTLRTELAWLLSAPTTQFDSTKQVQTANQPTLMTAKNKMSRSPQATTSLSSDPRMAPSVSTLSTTRCSNDSFFAPPCPFATLLSHQTRSGVLWQAMSSVSRLST